MRMPATPGRKKVTSPQVARKASKQLRDPQTPRKQRSVAGSAVAQAAGKTRKRGRSR
jgi:hypothetical protein